jgi:hypothetical protein
MLQRSIATSASHTYKWVKEDQDTTEWTSMQELKELGLSRDALNTIWCDDAAKKECINGTCSKEDTGVNLIEWWMVYAKYPRFHKILGKFNQCIFWLFHMNLLHPTSHRSTTC